MRSFGRNRSKARAIASLSTNSSIAVRARGSCARFGLGRLLARVGRSNRDLAQPDAVASRHQRGVRDDPVEPAVEGRRIAKPGQLPPGGHERVLGRVGSVRIVRQDRPGEAIAAVDPGVDEHRERRRIPVAGAANEGVVGRRRRDRCCRQRIHLAPRVADRSGRSSRCRRSSGAVGCPDAAEGPEVWSRDEIALHIRRVIARRDAVGGITQTRSSARRPWHEEGAVLLTFGSVHRRVPAAL